MSDEIVTIECRFNGVIGTSLYVFRVCYSDHIGGNMTTRIHVVLPDALLEEIDRIAGPRRRSEYIAETLEQSVLRERQRRALDEATAALKDYDYPGWETPEATSSWVRHHRRLDDEHRRNKPSHNLEPS